MAGAEKCQLGLPLAHPESGLPGDIWGNTGSWALLRRLKAGSGGRPPVPSQDTEWVARVTSANAKTRLGCSHPRVEMEDLEGFLGQEYLPRLLLNGIPPWNTQGLCP